MAADPSLSQSLPIQPRHPQLAATVGTTSDGMAPSLLATVVGGGGGGRAGGHPPLADSVPAMTRAPDATPQFALAPPISGASAHPPPPLLASPAGHHPQLAAPLASPHQLAAPVGSPHQLAAPITPATHQASAPPSTSSPSPSPHSQPHQLQLASPISSPHSSPPYPAAAASPVASPAHVPHPSSSSVPIASPAQPSNGYAGYPSHDPLSASPTQVFLDTHAAAERAGAYGGAYSQPPPHPPHHPPSHHYQHHDDFDSPENYPLPSFSQMDMSIYRQVRPREPAIAPSLLAAAGAHLFGMLHPPTGLPSEQPGDRHDKVWGTSFQYSDWETPGVPRLYMIITYSNGFQIWRVDDGVNAIEVLSERTPNIPIRIVKFVAQPFDEAPGEPFSRARPLLAVVPADGSNAQWSSKTVRFYSLSLASWQQQLSFHFEISDIFTTKQLFVVQHPEHLAIFHPANMQELHQFKYCNAGTSPTLAIGSKWIAFPSMKRVPSTEAEFSAWNLVSAAGSAVLSGISTIAAAANTLRDDYGGSSAVIGGSGGGGGGGGGGAHYPRAGDPHHHLPPTSSDPLALMAAGAVEVYEIASTQTGSTLRTISHFQAHSEAIANLTFSPDGSMLATADRSGTECRIFMVMPHQHLYTLSRGITRAGIQSITFSYNCHWVAISSSNGTAHIFPIIPHGGGKPKLNSHGPQYLEYQNFINPRWNPSLPAEFLHSSVRLKLGIKGDRDPQKKLGLSFVHYVEQSSPAVLVTDDTGLLSQYQLITGASPDPAADATALFVRLEHVAEWDCCRRESWDHVRPTNVPAVGQRKFGEDFWLSNVETATHVPRQNELWRSPRFTFKAFISPDDQQQQFMHGDQMQQALGPDQLAKLRDEFFEVRPTAPVIVRNSAPTAYHEGGGSSGLEGLHRGHMRTSGNGLADAMQTRLIPSAAPPLSYEEQRALDFRRQAATPVPSARPVDAWVAEDLVSRRPSSDPLRRSFTYEDILRNPTLAAMVRDREAAAAAGGYSPGRSSPQHPGYPADARRSDPTRAALYNPAVITDARDQRYVSSAVTATDPRAALYDRRSAVDPRYDDRRTPSSNDAYAALMARHGSSGTSDPRYAAAALPGTDRTRSDLYAHLSSPDQRGRTADPALDTRYAAAMAGGDRTRSDLQAAAALLGRTSSASDPTRDPRYASQGTRADPQIDLRAAAALLGRTGGASDPTRDPRYATAALPGGSDRTRSSDPTLDPRYAALLPGGQGTRADPSADRGRTADPTVDPRYAAALGGSDRTRATDPTVDPRIAAALLARQTGTSDPTRDPRYAASSERTRSPDLAADPRYLAMGRTTSGPAAEAEARLLQEQAQRVATQPRATAEDRERAFALLNRYKQERASGVASPDSNPLAAAMQTRR